MYKKLLTIRDLEAKHGKTAKFEVISRVFEAWKHGRQAQAGRREQGSQAILVFSLGELRADNGRRKPSGREVAGIVCPKAVILNQLLSMMMRSMMLRGMMLQSMMLRQNRRTPIAEWRKGCLESILLGLALKSKRTGPTVAMAGH